MPFVSRFRSASVAFAFLIASAATVVPAASAATPCDSATQPGQCGWFDSSTLPPFVRDAILAKQGSIGAGNVLVLTSGDPADPDSEISNDMGGNGCGLNPDGWDTYDCQLLDSFVPPQDSVVLALSSEWFEWYQTIFTDWMTIAGGGVPTVDVSINSWFDQNKVDIIPYGPWETGVVILTSLSAQKMVNFRVADSGDHIYDTAIVVVPASWFGAVGSTPGDPTLLCGDGTLEPGEECDDGNNVPDDGCNTLCLGSQPPSSNPPPTPTTCGNLVYTWPNGQTAPYTCGADLCAGFRCVAGNTISPQCYTAEQCAAACGGSCVDVQVAQLDCSTMCTVQPPATEPPPVVDTCASYASPLSYIWPDGTVAPYDCADSCAGQRCVTGATISPECYASGECDATSCPDGTCVDTPASDCAALCALGVLPTTCSAAEAGHTRQAANQQGPCHGNTEVCKLSSGEYTWKLGDGSFAVDDEKCNGIDDDCNGVVDDMFKTCGDPGLCQNTVNTCDLSNPTVPVACVPLPAPSDHEICNNGLDDDCDGSADDGCECGDEECMPGETYQNCKQDCPTPPANFTACDDGNPCTSGDQWYAGQCSGTPVSCDTGNACIVAGECDPVSGCSGTKLDCNDAVDCTVDTCDAAVGCLNTPDDGSCDDGNPCTTDTCDAVLGCLHDPVPLCGADDVDGDGHASIDTGGDDCDDNDAGVYPGAGELCDGIDQDCDGTADNGFLVGVVCESDANHCGATATDALVCSADALSVVCPAVTPQDPAGYGNACESGPNSCGQTASGSIGCDGCSAVTPADPVGFGEACISDPNSCGQTASGTIGCDGCNAVAPSDPAGYGTSCESAANACGQTATGSVDCNGDCSATTPTDPAGYGDACTSPANACGQTADGTIDCNGDCSAATPPDPAGYGTSCDSAPNACGETASGSVGCDGSCSAVTPAAADGDADGTPDCSDGCASDANKTESGACGCGVADSDANNNGVADCIETVKADLAARIELLATAPRAGKRLRWRLWASNAGPDIAGPTVTVFASISGSFSDLKLPSSCSGTADDIACELPRLKAGKGKSARISVVPAAGATLVVTATVASEVADPNPANQTATVTTLVP